MRARGVPRDVLLRRTMPRVSNHRLLPRTPARGGVARVALRASRSRALGRNRARRRRPPPRPARGRTSPSSPTTARVASPWRVARAVTSRPARARRVRLRRAMGRARPRRVRRAAILRRMSPIPRPRALRGPRRSRPSPTATRVRVVPRATPTPRRRLQHRRARPRPTRRRPVGRSLLSHRSIPRGCLLPLLRHSGARDDFAASEPRDAFVDGLLSHHARQELARQELARQSKRREGAHGGEGVRVRFVPANADASAAGTSDAATRTRRSERTAERTAASASTSSFARTPSGSFVEPPPLDASGARFGYLSAIPDDAAPCVGMDAVDLPSFALARVDSRRAMERVLFAGATDARSERRARWTADDAPRTRARASAAAETEGARLVEPSSFSSLATSALEAGARVLASVEGVLLEATKDRDGVPQLRLMMGSPADPPPRGLPPGALLNGARAAVALVGRAGVRGSLARVVLRHVPGLDVDVRLRCRFAGHFLPVATVASRGFLLDRTRTVVEIDASPPRPGFAPLEGAAFLETVAIRGAAAGLPVGHPVPVLLTTDPGARDEMNAATKRAAERSDSDAASRRVAWWLTCAMTAKTERACSREFVRRVVEYAWRAGAYRTLDALLRAHAHLPDADANVARTCDVAASGNVGVSRRPRRSRNSRNRPEALARTLASLDWSDADDVDARDRLATARSFARSVRRRGRACRTEGNRRAGAGRIARRRTRTSRIRQSDTRSTNTCDTDASDNESGDAGGVARRGAKRIFAGGTAPGCSSCSRFPASSTGDGRRTGSRC